MNQKIIIQKIKQIKALLEECINELSVQQTTKRNIGSQGKIITKDLDFGIPIRPFVKRYAKGLSGPKKFVLLLAWFVKGDEKKEVSLSDLQVQWEKMKGSSLLGLEFNRFFPAEAHENDWIERVRKGFYRLRPDWRNILS